MQFRECYLYYSAIKNQIYVCAKLKYEMHGLIVKQGDDLLLFDSDKGYWELELLKNDPKGSVICLGRFEDAVCV